MRTNVQIISPTAAAAQQGRGTRVTLVDPTQGLPHRTHVEIQGVEDVSADATAANDPMKTRVQILTRIPGEEAPELPAELPAVTGRDAMVGAIETGRQTLERLEQTARETYERLEQLQEALAEHDERVAAEATADDEGGIIETTGEEKPPDPAAAFLAEQEKTRAAEAARAEAAAAEAAAAEAAAAEAAAAEDAAKAERPSRRGRRKKKDEDKG